MSSDSSSDIGFTRGEEPDRKSIAEIVEENREVFELLREHPDAEFAEKYGERPLRYLTGKEDGGSE